MRREESSMALYENKLMVMVMALWWVVSSADGSDGGDAADATFYGDMDGSGTMREFHIRSSFFFFFFSLLRGLELTHSYTPMFFTSWTIVSNNFIPSFPALKVRLGDTNSHKPYFPFGREIVRVEWGSSIINPSHLACIYFLKVALIQIW